MSPSLFVLFTNLTGGSTTLTLLASLGWNDYFTARAQELSLRDVRFGRVATTYNQGYRLYCDEGEVFARISGAWRHSVRERGNLPAVGDFVAYTHRQGDDHAILHALVPRRTCFSRKAAGFVIEEQIIAANIDYVFLVMALNQDFSPRRLERYLTAIWESGARPVVILSKADLCEHPEKAVRETQAVAPGAEVIALSALQAETLEPLRLLFTTGGQVRTGVFTGSSGAGKSTLVNALLARAAMRVQDVRTSDDRGRHTTTHRELLLLPSGGLIIDTPGMRELQLWGSSDGLTEAFADIVQLTESCRYRDCLHDSEPGCAVQAALQAGTLSRERYMNYRKLERELAHVARQDDTRAQLAERKRWKTLTMQARRKGNRP